jgi:hypothetical protein
MKVLLTLLLLGWLGVSVWFIGTEVVAVRTCYTAYNKDLDDLAFRSHADKTVFCQATYDKIVALTSCMQGADQTIPTAVREQYAPVSRELERLLGYRGKAITDLEADHDVNCADHPDTMFTAPAPL